MSRVPIAAGNWKLNKNSAEARSFVNELKSLFPNSPKCEVIVSPVALSIEAAVEASNNSFLKIATQNCYHVNTGAFTGELSPQYIKDAGCFHSLTGHSERRIYFKETDKELSLKNKALIDNGMIPVFCIGETLEEREANQVEAVLERQLTYGLEGVDVTADNIIIAYEPVWAIGTGRVASGSDAQEAHSFVRRKMNQLFGSAVADGVRILYGGSAKPDNIEDLISRPDIDGALIGGASLKPANFATLIKAISASV